MQGFLLFPRKLPQFCSLRPLYSAAYLDAMTLHFRSYLTLFLVLAVTLTAHSAGAMRGMRDATGQLVICSGAGPVVIYVDADGQPARTPQDCPDCVNLSMDVLAAYPLGLLIGQGPYSRVILPDRRELQPPIPFQASARAPPFVF